MATARKMPSGNWKVRVYDYTDFAGKQHMKSFTASTKKEAERLATVYTRGQANISDLTVYEAVKSYIDVKEAALSPSTVRGYTSYMKKHFTNSRISNIRLSKLSNVIVQKFISGLVSEGKSPKTVHNIYGLFSAAIGMYRPEVSFQVTLPATEKPDLHNPATEEVEKLIESIKEDRELYICVLLYAFGPMRRSEVCAAKHEDIDRNTNMITVRRACVQDKSGNWVYKDRPKTSASYRTILYPQTVLDAIGKGKGYLITESTPQALTERFKKAIANTGLVDFRMHDLRHYCASILHAIGIPDQYILQRGGWGTDYCMKRVYRGVIDDVSKEMNQKAVDFFEKKTAKKDVDEEEKSENLDPNLDP